MQYTMQHWSVVWFSLFSTSSFSAHSSFSFFVSVFVFRFGWLHFAWKTFSSVPYILGDDVDRNRLLTSRIHWGIPTGLTLLLFLAEEWMHQWRDGCVAQGKGRGEWIERRDAISSSLCLSGSLFHYWKGGTREESRRLLFRVLLFRVSASAALFLLFLNDHDSVIRSPCCFFVCVVCSVSLTLSFLLVSCLCCSLYMFLSVPTLLLDCPSSHFVFLVLSGSACPLQRRWSVQAAEPSGLWTHLLG